MRTVADYPVLVRQWDRTRNGALKPSDVARGSGRKVWWRCQRARDHRWEASPNSRTRPNATGCPFCANQRASITNSVAARHPGLAREWHPNRNGALRPKDVAATSSVKRWWKCRAGHEWAAAPRVRIRPQGCPACANRCVTADNSLARRFPALAAQWHPTQNGALTPRDVVAGGHRRVWWQCPVSPDHAWSTKVKARTAGTRTGCPFCVGKRPSCTNSLAGHPRVAKEWHPTRNGVLTPADVVAGSNTPRWWKCPAGPDHEWRASPDSRTGRRARGCPFCAGRQVSSTNSLAQCFPDVASEWHPTRNGTLQPSDVVWGTRARAWWRCAVVPRHVWLAAVESRTRIGAGCPSCVVPRRSRQEVGLLFELRTLLAIDPDDHRVDLDAGGAVEADIVVRARRLVVEFDSAWWHRDSAARDRDRRKSRVLEAAGWTVIRVREAPLRPLSPRDVRVPQAAPKRVADLVVRQIASVTRRRLAGLKRYLRAPDLQANHEADAYWRTLQRRAEKKRR